jgi:type IV pilus assembly protein PilE
MAMPRRARPPAVPPSRQAGFTLIELLIAVSVLGILAAIAYPQYTEFVQRSRITDATSGLNDFRTRMEQFFQDNRTYANGANCGVPNPAVSGSSNFQIVCGGATAAGYTINANGIAAKGMGAFRYRLVVNAAGITRSTQSLPTGWTASATCWSVRRNGECS